MSDFAIERGVKSYEDELQRGRVPNQSTVEKFGRATVGTTYVPIAFGNVYQQLQVAAATTLRVKAGNGNDTAAGSGAREITLDGLDETGARVTPALATAGASASDATTETFIRLYRYYVSASGTYSAGITGSHDSNIVIENGAGGTDWATIDSTDIPRGQSEIACYTVPLGKTATISHVHVTV